MKKQIADKWVKALRSGDYEQTHGILNEPGYGFCCLGVLCDLYPDAEWDTEWEEVSFLGQPYELPDEVMAWAGMETKQGNIDSKDIVLTDLNDGTSGEKPHSFKQIANTIEKYYKEL